MTLTTKSRFHRLVRGLRALMEDRRLGPDSVLGSALARWCKEAFPGLPRTGLPSAPSLQSEQAVSEFVHFVKAHDLLEATYWFASAYAQLAGDEQRKRFAMFFTPPSLTKRLLDDLSASGVDFATRSFCDPACGGAAFLAPIAMRMRDALRVKGASAAEVLDHVQSHLMGFDTDAALCKLSKHFLLMALHDEVLAAEVAPKFRIRQGDSLLQLGRLQGTLDVVVCNPPFRKMPAAEVQQYADKYGDVIEAQPNLYALFIVLCVKLLSPGGTCALVTPTSFLSGQNFAKLRTLLMTQTRVLSIGMVSDRLGVFIDVEQETALTLVRQEDAGHAPTTEASVSVVTRNGSYASVGRCALPNSGASWPIPRTEDDVALLKCAAKSRARLANYGYATRIGAFVWNRDPRATYASADAAARAKAGTAVPLLWSSDVAPDGSLRFTGAPKDNKENCFVDMGAPDHTSVVRRPSVLLQRVTSNGQPRRLVAAAIPQWVFDTYGGFVGENHTVILEQVTDHPALTPEELAALLGTPPVDRYFRCISGAPNVSVFELGQLCLPPPDRLRDYLSQGMDMASAAHLALRKQ